MPGLSFRDEQAVSSVIGDILLVSITVTMAVGLSAMVLAFDGPQHDRPASIDVRFSPGVGGWGTGDEEILLRHRGGMDMDARFLSLTLDQNGTQTLLKAPPTGPFSDGQFSIGEVWVIVRNIPGGQPVEALLVNREFGSVALAYGGITPDMANDCSQDVQGPTVAQWTQTPSDVDAFTVGPVIVTARLMDDCSGTLTWAPPSLAYRLEDGSEAAWQTVASTFVSGTTFTAQVPEGAGWGPAQGKTLEYRFLAMADQAGNTRDSQLQTDIIQTGTTYTYPSCPPTVAPGTSADCIKLQSASDGGAEARFDEAAILGAATNIFYGTTVTPSPPTSNQGEADGAPDNLYAVLVGKNDRSIVGGFAAGTGTIQKVEIFYEGHHQGSYGNDVVRLRYRLGGSLTGTFLDVAPTASDSIASLDVSLDRSWTWSQIANMAVDAEFRANANEDAIDIYVDALWIRVTSDATTYDLQGDLAFASVPAGTTHTLELRYRVFTDTFSVQIWDGSAWNTRGTTLMSGVATNWPAIDLSGAEYQGGAPKIRFIDRDTQPASPGQLLVDYVRIKSI